MPKLSNDHPKRSERTIAPLAYTRAEARLMLSLGHTTVDKLIADGTLASVKIGRRRLIPAASLHRLLSGETIKPTA